VDPKRGRTASCCGIAVSVGENDGAMELSTPPNPCRAGTADTPPNKLPTAPRIPPTSSPIGAPWFGVKKGCACNGRGSYPWDTARSRSNVEGLLVTAARPMLAALLSVVGNCNAVTVFKACVIGFGISFGATSESPPVATTFAADPKNPPMLPRNPIPTHCSYAGDPSPTRA